MQLLFGFLWISAIVGATWLRCGNYSQPVTVQPSAPAMNSGVLVTWDLFSNDKICTDPPRTPTFSTLLLADVSVVALCDDCPRCSVKMPMRYEMPLGSSINTIFIVTKQMPFHRMHTDLDVRYVLVKKRPKSVRNCEVLAHRAVERHHDYITFESAALFVLIFASVIICVCFVRCFCARIY